MQSQEMERKEHQVLREKLVPLGLLVYVGCLALQVVKVKRVKAVVLVFPELLDSKVMLVYLGQEVSRVNLVQLERRVSQLSSLIQETLFRGHLVHQVSLAEMEFQVKQE